MQDEKRRTASHPAHDLTPAINLTLHHGSGPFRIRLPHYVSLKRPAISLPRGGGHSGMVGVCASRRVSPRVGDTDRRQPTAGDTREGLLSSARDCLQPGTRRRGIDHVAPEKAKQLAELYLTGPASGPEITLRSAPHSAHQARTRDARGNATSPAAHRNGCVANGRMLLPTARRAGRRHVATRGRSSGFLGGRPRIDFDPAAGTLAHADLGGGNLLEMMSNSVPSTVSLAGRWRGVRAPPVQSYLHTCRPSRVGEDRLRRVRSLVRLSRTASAEPIISADR